jgi:hypothetical protein
MPEMMRASVIRGIEEHLRTYGVHPQCKYCRHGQCRQYAAPHSKILFCPRIEQQCQQSASS